MLLWSDVKTALDSAWNAVIITEPSYVNGKLQKTALIPGTLYIWDEQTEPIPIAYNYYEETTTIYIYICSLNQTNLALYESEIKRILMAVTSAHYRLKDMGRIATAFQDCRADRLLVFEVRTCVSYT
jgi:hypothetical protein